ncbi:YchF/TatD family DNA exonuclease [Candidatus Woesearchaeota archaeon]|nr:YchF/TatD family DNA exonuclease [Candidatus Woesearchaeota archaeon]
MILVDVHTHLDHPRMITDVQRIVERARKAGVKRIISNGSEPASNRKVLQLAKQYDIVRCAVGAYPIDALQFDLNKEITSWSRCKEDFVALGEVGLDYLYDKERQEEQRANFAKILATAKKWDKPLIVHTRKAEEDCISMILDSGIDPTKTILHCFMGRKTLVKKAAEAGMNFSIPPIICRLDHFKMVVREVNINQLFTETDAPFLGPDRETRNEPAFVKTVIEEIAAIKGFAQEEVANAIFMNYQRVFE